MLTLTFSKTFYNRYIILSSIYVTSRCYGLSLDESFSDNFNIPIGVKV